MRTQRLWIGCVLLFACGNRGFIAGDRNAGGSGSGGAPGAGGSAGNGGSAATGTGGSNRGGSGGVGATAGSGNAARGGSAGTGATAGAAGRSDCDCGLGGERLVCGIDGTTYDASCGTDCVSVEVACEGPCPCDGGGSGGSAGTGSGAGGEAGAPASGGSGGMSAAGGGAGASCTVTNDSLGCLCFSEVDCSPGQRCYGADCTTNTAGTCATPPPTGCFDSDDCPAGQTCNGGRLAPCGSTMPDVLGTCESTCTLEDPTSCPTGFGCACRQPNNPNVPPECVCHKQCGAPTDCSGTDSLCGCGPGVADGLCVSSCFCLCG